MSLVVLSDEALIQVYEEAIEQNLESAFIQILLEEIARRGLSAMKTT